MSADAPLLFTPLKIRSITLPNRVVIPPMDQYSATDGLANEFHQVHYGKFALGGAGTIIVEASGVLPEGRITHGCLGIWNDDQVTAFKPITDFMRKHGSVPAIQLGHGGRKGSMQRPWHGNAVMTETDIARGDQPWQPLAPSAVPMADGWPVPKPMDDTDLQRTREAMIAAAKRAVAAGFEVVEIHMAHGYLLQSFLSPVSNQRNDKYGGDRAGRMRFPLEIAEAVRSALPDGTPLFVRVSSVDGVIDGWDLEDTIVFAQELKARGVDVIDCSSGGASASGATNANLKREPGFQVPFAEGVRREADMLTQAVGLIRDPFHAEQILQEGRADLIAIGRQALWDPFWALHASQALNIDPDFEQWPHQYAWWLEKWDKGIKAREAEEAAE